MEEFNYKVKKESNYIIDIINKILRKDTLSVYYSEKSTEPNHLELSYQLYWDDNDINHSIITTNVYIDTTKKDKKKSKLVCKQLFSEYVMKDIFLGIKVDDNIHFPDIIEHIKNMYKIK